MLKKIIGLIALAVIGVSAVSCGNVTTSQEEHSSADQIAVGDIPLPELLDNAFDEDDDLEKYILSHPETIIGSTEEVDYQKFLENEYFYYMFANYLDSNNGLDLAGGVPENAVVLKPFKSVLTGSGLETVPMNLWIFPVADGGTIIGFVNVDCRLTADGDFFGGVTYAPALNEALKNGRLAVFQPYDGSSIYAIYEDGSIVTLYGDSEYGDSPITYDEIAGFGYAIDESIFDEVIYTEADGSQLMESLYASE